MWSSLLEKASHKADNTGRSDLADLLRLRLANDTVRQAGVDWLFDTLIELTFERQEAYQNLKIARTSPHTFKSGLSTMVGSLVEIGYGVRCLSAEAGWARTPSDGVMRDGGLAQANIRHFGMSAKNMNYRLVSGDSLPVWINDAGVELNVGGLSRHLDILVGA